MTKYVREGKRPEIGHYEGFDHVGYYVSNAKQVAAWYVLRFGFEYVAYKGLETGSRDESTWVVRQNKITFAFTSPLEPKKTEMARRIKFKGDAVKDVAFACKDAEAIYKKAIERGAVSVLAPVEEKDEFGTVVRATVKTYGDTVHSFVQRNDYKGVFLPGYKPLESKDPLSSLLPSPELQFIDHVVGNQPDQTMESVLQWYEKVLGFHRFWSVDDKQIVTQYSALRSVVMTDWDEKIKMPMNEPAPGLRKSQIQEYIDYHGEAGVQHIALNTNDIIHAVGTLKKRGLDFLVVPSTYYVDVRKRLAKCPVKVKENLDTIESLNVLIDFDDKGYLLQIFTKPVQDRPTLFYEVIQRNNHEGFGAGNFKSLFEAIERDQALRGNLTSDKPKDDDPTEPASKKQKTTGPTGAYGLS
jgi:4-hydroxyphenylpyruvate dioxygenase